MKARLFLLALLLAPGFALAEDDPCHWLQAANAQTVFAAPVTLEPGFSQVTGPASVQLCTATTEAGASLALLYRSMDAGGQSLAELVTAYQAELADVMNPPPSFDPVAVGEAALWEPSSHQLTVWSHGGAVMMVFTLFGPQAKAQCTALARAIVAAGG